MSIALVVTSQEEAERVLPWAWRIAFAEQVDLVLSRVNQRDDVPSMIELDDEDEIDSAFPGLRNQWEGLNATRAYDEGSQPAIDEGSTQDQTPLPSVKLSVKVLTAARK